ncbi:vitelline membrane protein 15a-1-like [Anopheles aquasalis]|uniref:vitelline membrane protein 15a-1-like n=1 Tax=Anopheles aquasalis TaxID=42839 RepID=UPI00215AD81D|nr:vitelline membrane protein 15a-1-like [Anopheles aquasalis]
MNGIIAITLLAVVGVAIAAPSKYGGHGHGGHVAPGPAVEYTYDAVAPAAKCGHNLLINCNPHHVAVPCKAAEHGHGYGHHAPAPAHHAPAPAYHHAPAPAYHHAPAPAHAPEYREAKKHGKKHGKKHFEGADSSSEMMFEA